MTIYEYLSTGRPNSPNDFDKERSESENNLKKMRVIIKLTIKMVVKIEADLT